MTNKLNLLFWTAIGDEHPVTFQKFMKWYSENYPQSSIDETSDQEIFGILWQWSCEKGEYEWELKNTADWWEDIEVNIDAMFEQEEPEHESEDD
jgi:hypothetical protein